MSVGSQKSNFPLSDFDDDEESGAKRPAKKQDKTKNVAVKREAVLDLVEDSPKKGLFVIGSVCLKVLSSSCETNSQGRRFSAEEKRCQCVAAFRRFGLEQAARFQKKEVNKANFLCKSLLIVHFCSSSPGMSSSSSSPPGPPSPPPC